MLDTFMYYVEKKNFKTSNMSDKESQTDAEMWGGSRKWWGETGQKKSREAGVGIEDRRWEKQQRSFNISSEMIYLSTLWQLQPSGLNNPTTASIMEAEQLRCSASANRNKKKF